MELIETSDTFTLSLTNKRDVVSTMPWFVEQAKYPPRPANVIVPLINGEKAFAAVYDAIDNAKHSVEIISWGIDPSMRLKPPHGERLGDLLRRKATGQDGPAVQVRVLIWKNALANLGENNIVGDGLMTSGGTALGSGVGSTSAGGGSGGQAGFNDYGKLGNSAGVQRDDDEARAYNRNWYTDLPPKLEFRTRDYNLVDRFSITTKQVSQRGLASPAQTIALAAFASHHQKVILVDYESPEDAIGFVMGHNLLRNYWDTDAHEYHSEARFGFAPWQDLSCQVRGPVLHDLNENFMTAWDKASSWWSRSDDWPAARKALTSNDFIAPAQKHGQGVMAQICRTQSQEGDRSILDAYRLAIGNGRTYLYFENQYFRYKEMADLIRQVRRKLKGAGWKRDFYVFVVTNVPDGHGRTNTYEMLAALGQGQRMPEYHRETERKPDPDADLRKDDLEGLNIHIATLKSWGTPHGQSEIDYKDIYVHSKLFLADDVFFTLGSANINVRSLETDSELNIACPSPSLTRQWREHLWRIHTGGESLEDMAREFKRWGDIISENAEHMNEGKPLAAPLVDFYDNNRRSTTLD
ncbi:hypothetical protein DZ930_008595 [Pseudomonas aeruginosa]|uniref:phospholipase D-like domain-containing protein n=1 Tax=Pseudomonas aeruginosa TaxID=287 RepID=UPI000E3232B9|nr:phospholipase D-like domain-containing protein [Pseudomonas aeruginosa]MDN3859985.1 hypothetical protein [Pseudomonas aeruginosa]NQA60816.1 hypothetical protein [Pseudomonas aeruginosa]RPU02541.1 hypothetical protein IPC927_12420 [Pseudomonas aeruginosa]HCS8192695.1 hypothetical protein [Pseudomonas aeruginosa]